MKGSIMTQLPGLHLRQQSWLTPLWLAGLLAAGLTLTACSSEPEGYSKGRIGTTTTTEGETRSNQILPTALIEASDQTASRLAQDLANIPQVRNAGGRVTVLVGDINNKTGVTSSTDFEMLRSRIRSNLLQSRYVKDQVNFVENRARMRSIAGREEVGDNPVAAGPDKYDPNTTFALNGDFIRVFRDTGEGYSNLYYIEFQLVHFKTNEIVFSDKYEIKQWRP